MKNPLTPAGIEPATFRYVAQHLNHCATAVTVKLSTKVKNYKLKTGKLFLARNKVKRGSIGLRLFKSKGYDHMARRSAL